MFIVSEYIESENLYGILDTEDGVTEYYSRDSLSGIVKTTGVDIFGAHIVLESINSIYEINSENNYDFVFYIVDFDENIDYLNVLTIQAGDLRIFGQYCNTSVFPVSKKDLNSLLIYLKRCNLTVYRYISDVHKSINKLCSYLINPKFAEKNKLLFGKAPYYSDCSNCRIYMNMIVFAIICFNGGATDSIIRFIEDNITDKNLGIYCLGESLYIYSSKDYFEKNYCERVY